MEEEEDDFYATNGNAPKQEFMDEGDDNQSEQMDEDIEDGEDDDEESDSAQRHNRCDQIESDLI
jgi:hypothetical protein